MPEVLLNQKILIRVLGQSRLQRLLNAKWLQPVKRRRNAVLFSSRDVHAALSRLERERCPPDKIAIGRTRAWEQRTGNGYQKVPARKPASIELDFSAFGL